MEKELLLNIPADHLENIFGQFDHNIKIIENALEVSVVNRGDSVKIIGEDTGVEAAKNVVNELLSLSKRGNHISEQNVRYALSLKENIKDHPMVKIDEDLICHTITGKPVKPKTVGQKKYVDAIRKRMVVFGIGPAGTGKIKMAKRI